MGIYQDALKYVNNFHWSVIPLKEKDKVPAISSWKEYQQRLPTTMELSNWFMTQTKANIGILTGPLSGLSVLDADSIQGLNILKEQKVYSPIAVQTTKGRHLYFKYYQGLGNATRFIQDVDIRSDGGYVVAPPSTHSSGYRYSWLSNITCTDALPTFPSWLLQSGKVVESNKTQIGQLKYEDHSNCIQHEDEHICTEVKTKNIGWIESALKDLKPGNIDDTFTKVIGKLHHSGIAPNDIHVLLTPYAMDTVHPFSRLKDQIDYITRKYPNETNQSKENSRLGKRFTIYSARSHWEEYQQEKDRKSSLQRPEMETGIKGLDKLITELRRGEIYVIGARTGVGKTCLCLNISRELCETNKRVLYLSTEMSYISIWDRLIYQGIRKTPEGFLISDMSNPDRESVEWMIKENQPDVLVIDHIQHVGDSLTNRYQEIGKFIKALKDLARQYKIVILVASQLNRGAEYIDPKTGNKVKPRIYHLAECGGIENEATVVMLLSKDHEIDDNTSFYTLDVVKNRYGNCGELGLIFDKRTTKMIES